MKMQLDMANYFSKEKNQEAFIKEPTQKSWWARGTNISVLCLCSIQFKVLKRLLWAILGIMKELGKTSQAKFAIFVFQSVLEGAQYEKVLLQ